MNTSIVRRHPSFSRSLWIGLALVLTLGTGQTTRAASGDLDPLFGTGGKVITDFSGYADWAEALVLQPDRKLVAAGATTDGFGLARYNPDGALDKTFGVEGKATVVFGGDLIAAAYALVLQPEDGKLVAAGLTNDSRVVNGIIVNNYGFAVARFDSNGVLDPTFGPDGTGTVTMHFGAGVNSIAALVLQPEDGKLVAAGDVSNGSHFNITLVRYTDTGRLDETFGNGGKVTTDFGVDSHARALVLQPNGQLVVAGDTFVVGNNTDFVLVRYNENGTPDTSFGSGGRVTTDFSGDRDRAGALVLQGDKLVAGGGNGTGGFKLARYNMDGTLDTSFGAGGKVTTNFGGSLASVNALVLQPDGSVVAAGGVLNGSRSNLVLARYDTEGALDATFGAGGQVIIDFAGASVFDQGDLVLQDGKLVAAGSTSDGIDADPAGDTLDFALARYDPASTVTEPILTVTTAGTGSGTVTSNPMRIVDCSNTCKASFSTGTAVTLAYKEGLRSSFTGWSGDCVGGAVTMTADKTCTASFTRIVHKLTVTRGGAGSGTVTSDLTGIACGLTCEFSFPEGDLVQLNATAAPDSSFGGWSGDCDPIQGTVTMSTDKTCTATFNPLTVSTINLTSSGNPSLVGQAVTITATVTGSAPTGLVMFAVDNGLPVTGTITGATATTLTATIQINLAVGQHPITASYFGNGINAGSTATPLFQNVLVGESSGTATRVILTGTHNGILFNQDKGNGKFAADSDIRASDINLGTSYALGSLPAGGPSVGALSTTLNTPSVPFVTYGIGGARAIAYATYINQNSKPVTRQAHADLHGSLLGGVIEHATGAVYVFDANRFLATIPNSATAMREFLLGGDTLAGYADANPATLSLARLFSPAVVRASAFEAVTSSKNTTQVTKPVVTGDFTVDPGQSVIIMFDITVYADKGGFVDFASTLKPAPVFLTDAAGNPAPLTPVGLWSPTPPAAVNLALTPAVTANALTTPVTLTATATTASGAPVPNTQVFLEITAGPNAQPLGPLVTDANGQITFTYAGGGATGTDQIQAHIDTLQSNVAQITWAAGPPDHITLSPATATIAAGGSQVYSVQVLDAFNNGIGDVTTSTAFSISPDGSCLDETCTATAAGPHTVTATYGGLTATATLNVNKVPTTFTFQGFFAPIDMSTASVAVWNTLKAGQAVPVKWLLTLDGAPVSDPASFAGLVSYPIACSSGAGSIDDAINEIATGSSGLQYNGDGNWQFNWKTLSSYKNTCRSVAAKFSDGTTSPAANFKFK